MSDTISGILKSTAGLTLDCVGGIVKKADAHARATGAEDTAFMSARLYPDMFDLSMQFVILSEVLLRSVQRYTGTEPPALGPPQTGFLDCLDRIEKTREFVMAADDAALDAKADQLMDITVLGETLQMTGRHYLVSSVLPNMYFHATTIYGLLRHQGVPLGKKDFLEPPAG